MAEQTGTSRANQEYQQIREYFLSRRSEPFPEEVDIIFVIDCETEANALSALGWSTGP